MESAKTPNPPTVISSSATHLLIIKLTSTNYLLWKAQVTPFLKGNQLYGFVDGTCPMPPPLIYDQPNPNHEKWIIQGQLLLSVHNSSLSNSIFTHVLECSTSRDVWITLHSLFSDQTNAYLMQTHIQLATLKKGSNSISFTVNKVY